MSSIQVAHMIEGVIVVRHPTPLEALEAGFGKPKIAQGFFRSDKQIAKDIELTELLSQPLSWEHEGEARYTRTMALVYLEWEMEEHAFNVELAKSDFYPASLSESMAYLPMLAARGIAFGAVFHLGVALRDEEFREFRLLTRGKGEVEKIPMYQATKLKQFYRIVVVKKEKEEKKKKK